MIFTAVILTRLGHTHYNILAAFVAFTLTIHSVLHQQQVDQEKTLKLGTL